MGDGQYLIPVLCVHLLGGFIWWYLHALGWVIGRIEHADACDRHTRLSAGLDIGADGLFDWFYSWRRALLPFASSLHYY